MYVTDRQIQTHTHRHTHSIVSTMWVHVCMYLYMLPQALPDISASPEGHESRLSVSADSAGHAPYQRQLLPLTMVRMGGVGPQELLSVDRILWAPLIELNRNSERERERQTDRQTDRQRQKERGRERVRETETETERISSKKLLKPYTIKQLKYVNCVQLLWYQNQSTHDECISVIR